MFRGKIESLSCKSGKLSYAVARFFFGVIAILITTLAPQYARCDVDIAGNWTFIYSAVGGSRFLTGNFTLYTSGTIVAGTATANGKSLLLSGTDMSSQVQFFLFKNETQIEVTAVGTVTDENSMTGTWQDADTNSGVWTATRTPGSTIVTPATHLKEPPAVQVTQHAVTLSFQAFLGASKVKNRSVINSRVLKSAEKFQYAVQIDRVKNALGQNLKQIDRLNRISRRNQITLHSLEPGQYTARYQVQITEKTGSSTAVVGTTGFSPRATFNIE